jgi:hypothetical protein
MKKTQAHVHISPGNSKLGKIANISLAPVTGCPSGVPCRKDCYALRLSNLRPLTKKAWSENLYLAQNFRDIFFAAISSYIYLNEVPFFRWHVSGDILDQDYLDRMVSIAKRFPGTMFLNFTKAHSLKFKRQFNLTTVFSMWPNWGDVDQDMPRAWLNDGTDPRIPKTAIKCPGNCETCGMCWSLPQIRRDVVFDKH